MGRWDPKGTGNGWRLLMLALTAGTLLTARNCVTETLIGAATTEYDVPEAVEEAAEKYGAAYGICPEFLEAVAFHESSYKPDAWNGSCAGLMQVDVSLHADRMERLGVNDVTEVDGNMATAADYFAELFEEYGGEAAEVLMAYNGDSRLETVIEGYGSISEYAESVLKLTAELERLHGK